MPTKQKNKTPRAKNPQTRIRAAEVTSARRQVKKPQKARPSKRLAPPSSSAKTSKKKRPAHSKKQATRKRSSRRSPSVARPSDIDPAAPPAPVYELKPVAPLHPAAGPSNTAPSPASTRVVFPGLLDRARIQWMTGDWKALASMEVMHLEHNPDRAPLALFASMALFRTGRASEGRQFLALALRWGCDRQTAARILWASLHRNLAAVHALNRRENRVQQHLRLAAIVCGEPEVSLEEKALDSPRLPRLAGSRQIASGKCIVLLVAGMRHSGSTALFNILRLGLAKAGHQFVSCYSEHENCASKVRQAGRMGLIKTHEFRDDLLAMADFVLTARRDVRDTVASAARRDFPLYRQLRTPVEYAKYNRTLYGVWAPHSDFEFVYEQFIADPVAVTGDVLEAVGLARSWAPEICREVLNLPTDDYQTTLLSPQHITDPTHQLTYRDTLAPADIMAMQAHHYDWLQRHGYSIPTKNLTPA